MAEPSVLNEAITLGVALLGAGLGLMNIWQSLSTSRVKLRVKPTFAIVIPQGQSMFSIEVVNLSNFPVTISEVGFTLDGNSLAGPRAAARQIGYGCRYDNAVSCPIKQAKRRPYQA